MEKVCRLWPFGNACRKCLQNKFEGARLKGHLFFRAETKKQKQKRRILSMKRPVGVTKDGPVIPKGGPSIIETLYPVLWEYLTDDKWEDGAKRDLPTILFFIEAGQWKICLSDKALERVTFVAGATPDDALESLGLRMETDTVEWRAKKPFVPAKKKS